MKTDSHGKFCPFCIDNGVVEVIDEHRDAFLAQVVKDENGAKVKQPGRYFIIPKRHMESLFDRPDTWTRDEITLLGAAFMRAAQDEQLMELMRSRPLMESLNMSWNQGEWAGQQVRHIHQWVIFRYDGLRLGMEGLIGSNVQQQARLAELEFGRSYDLATSGLPH